MADAFAPKLTSDVRFNQPVEAPSTLGALAGLGGFFAKEFFGDGGGAGPAQKGDPNLATFRAGLERVEAIRQDRGEMAALVAERTLASNFAMAGVTLGKEYEDVYRTTTGRNWEGYGQDVEARTVQETMKRPEFQSAYVASFAAAPGLTEEERIGWAIDQIATNEAASLEIQKANSGAQYKWTAGTEAAYSTETDNFLNTALGALSLTTQQGGRITPNDVLSLQAQWSQKKIALKRPPGVTDDQWKATKERFDDIDELFTVFSKAASSEAMLEEFTTAVAHTLSQGGTISNILAATVALKDPATALSLSGGAGQFKELFMKAGADGLRLPVSQQSLFGHALNDQGSLVGDTDPNSYLSSIPDEIMNEVKGKTPEQIYKGLEVSGLLSGMVKSADLINRDSREQFVTNAATIGAVLMSNPDGQFLSDASLKKLIANPQFIRNIIALDVIDPEGATVARKFVRSGLSVEKARQVANFGSIEAYLDDKGVVWDGTAYVAKDPDAPGRVIPSLGGMGAFVTNPLQEHSAVIKEAMDRRAAVATIDGALKALEVKVPEGSAAQSSATPDSRFFLGDVGNIAASELAPGSSYKLPEEVSKDTDFVKAASQVASSLNLPVDDLFRVIEFETAGSWSPNIKNTESSATGLIQFLESTAKGLGTSTSALAGMTRAEQMTYVAKYLEPYKDKIKNFGDLYLAIHYPAAIGKSETFVMYKEGSAEYTANKNLDTNGDGTVTRGETVAAVMARTGGTGRGVMSTPATVETGAFLEAAQGDISSALPTAADLPAQASGTAPMAATAALPVAVQSGQGGATSEGGAAPVPQVDSDVRALIKELSESPDQTFATFEEFLAAQENGSLSPGETVVVAGEVYIIQKFGTAKRLGPVK